MLGWLTRRRGMQSDDTSALTMGNPIVEKRASGWGYTAQILAAREAYISGRSGLGELTATVQSCVSLWEGALSIADVIGTDLLTRRIMGIMARSLALRGEAVFLIQDELVPATDWDVSTRNGTPRAYRLSVPEAGGGRSETALAGEVLHVVLAADPVAPWTGQAPLRRAALSASLLNELESALLGVFQNAPLGSMIVPLDAGGGEALEQVRAGLRGRRGAALIVEYLSQAIAGGAPVPGRGVDHLSPPLRDTMVVESLEAARASIMTVFGVLPSLFDTAAQGPLVREAQRHLAGFVLQPIAALIAEEASLKLGADVTIDTIRPLAAFDAGGRARALATTVEALVAAKAGGVTPAELAGTMALLDFGPDRIAP